MELIQNEVTETFLYERGPDTGWCFWIQLNELQLNYYMNEYS